MDEEMKGFYEMLKEKEAYKKELIKWLWGVRIFMLTVFILILVSFGYACKFYMEDKVGVIVIAITLVIIYILLTKKFEIVKDLDDLDIKKLENELGYTIAKIKTIKKVLNKHKKGLLGEDEMRIERIKLKIRFK